MKLSIAIPALALFTKIRVFMILLFIASQLIIAEESSKHKEDSKRVAEVVITMTWDANSREDIDLWVQQPDGKRVFYSNMSSTIAALERDDRGYETDYYTDASGQTHELKDNTENFVLRQLMPGEYIVNVFYFSKHDEKYGPNHEKPAEHPAVTVRVKAEKMNPRLSLIREVTRTLPDSKTEATAFRFTVSPTGEITDVNEVPLSIVSDANGTR